MTTTVSFKTAIIAVLMAALIVPAMSFAATPSVAELQTQYQTLMSQFEQLKSERRGSNASSTASSTEKTSPRRGDRASSTVDRSCMATAVATRDASLKSVWTTFSTSIVSALDARSTALIAAWNASSTNQGNINQAWSKWKSDRLAAAKKLHSDRQAAWETFRKTAANTCKAKVPKAEGLEKSGGDDINL